MGESHMNTIKNGKIVKIPQDEYDRMFHPIRYAQKESEKILNKQGGEKM